MRVLSTSAALLGLLALVKAAPLRLIERDSSTSNSSSSTGGNREMILGTYNQCTGQLCDWMSKIPDDKPLSHITIPGTHDSATGNYPDSLGSEGLSVSLMMKNFVTCQQQPLFSQLNSGIRALDLRIVSQGNGPNGHIGFTHGPLPVTKDVDLKDVIDGLYYWIDQHPTETILISLKVDDGDLDDNVANGLNAIFDEKDSKATSHWVRSAGVLPTMKEARGKLVLLRRVYEWTNSTLPGLNVKGAYWRYNNVSFTVGNETVPKPNQQDIYVQDYFELDYPAAWWEKFLITSDQLDYKREITIQHLVKAQQSIASGKPDIYISFTSGQKMTAWNPGKSSIVGTPEDVAIKGIGDAQAVNVNMTAWFKQEKANDPNAQFGIVFVDFFDGVDGMIETMLGLPFQST